ncbi:CpsD/CapB family tyrosine-protein kinase [Paenibacillus timonensis]|uniref:non-specific protein-tyrosine kinase n=2 Tax=Paenibacillus timonensis TaxID=225915 RepID=A0ABW3SCW7_9BACL|nr:MULTISPECIES: CpsD/CapB family tyrosine-protein kinase [Paenibacillus]MCH1640126.1 CpsD/CapB family tyrosine-protein kinase [Paenibacillus timonensis]MDU2239841.1 CpsD/CapB family tyrosine-protein kinase [Paenibacillus sp.]
MRQSIHKYPLIMDMNPRSFIAESYRSLRTNIEFSSFDDELKTIAVTSAKPGEGKTTTAVNMALAFAQAGKSVVLIDADLRKPSIHHIFNKHNKGGLSNIIAKKHLIHEMIQETHIEHLSIIPSGPLPANPSEMLSSDAFSEMLNELKMNYSVIIVDSAPALTVTDAQVVAAQCDGAILVVNSGKAKHDSVIKVKEQLDYVKARLLGVVLNNVKRHRRNKREQAYY